MEYFLLYIKNICCFTVIISVILTIFPDEKYKKYIKLFAGFLLLLLVINPVIKIKDMDIKIDKIINHSYKEKTDFESKDIEEMQTKIWERISEKYQGNNKNSKNK